MANEDIKLAVIKSGKKQWQIAQKMGIYDSAFSRLLRNELTQEKKTEILNAIEDLKK